MSLAWLIDKIYATPYLRLGVHGLFWGILLAVRLHLMQITFNVYSGFPLKTLILLDVSSVSFMALFYYSLVYGLYPKFFLHRRIGVGLVGFACLFIGYTILDSFVELSIIRSCDRCYPVLQSRNPAYKAFLENHFSNLVLKRVVSLGTLFALLFSLCIPLMLKIALGAYRNRIKTLQLAHENLQLEFNFLRAQLNPHFLFNSMNNIYGLILAGEQEKSASLVARLSELLRYMIYDSNQSTMSLEQEVKLIEDYIELEKVRLNYLQVHFTYHTDNRAYQVAPLLLMPLIENAFKFAVDQPSSALEASLQVRKGRLHFRVVNGKDPNRLPAAEGGVGLMNIRKRLDLYYPGKYQYEIVNAETTYRVTLTLELSWP